jgi:hypothetical protein
VIVCSNQISICVVVGQKGGDVGMVVVHNTVVDEWSGDGLALSLLHDNVVMGLLFVGTCLLWEEPILHHRGQLGVPALHCVDLLVGMSIAHESCWQGSLLQRRQSM